QIEPPHLRLKITDPLQLLRRRHRLAVPGRPRPGGLLDPVPQGRLVQPEALRDLGARLTCLLVELHRLRLIRIGEASPLPWHSGPPVTSDPSEDTVHGSARALRRGDFTSRLLTVIGHCTPQWSPPMNG